MNIELEISKMSHQFKIKKKDKEDIDEYLSHNEWGLAFEVLCASLKENKLKISQEDYEIINMLGNQMELDCKLWSALKNNIGEI